MREELGTPGLGIIQVTPGQEVDPPDPGLGGNGRKLLNPESALPENAVAKSVVRASVWLMSGHCPDSGSNPQAKTACAAEK